MKKLIILTVLCGAALTAGAQNMLHSSQYMHHQALVNSAQTVQYNALTAAVFYKNQWTGFDGAPTMQGLSIGQPLKGYKSSWNAQIFHDKIGVNNTFQIGGGYAYKLQLTDNVRLGLGLGAYMNMAQSNFADIETTVSNDPVYQTNTKMQIMPNFRFGAYLYAQDYYFGVAAPNLLKNRLVYEGDVQGSTEFDMSDIHTYWTAGYRLEFDRDLIVWPSVLVKNVSGSPLQADFNINAKFSEKVGFGLSYRTSQELVIMGNYNITEELMIGYSYDIGFSDIAIFAGGSHEILLTYKVRSSVNPDKPIIKEDDEKPKIEI